jgi:hypothetical protein
MAIISKEAGRVTLKLTETDNEITVETDSTFSGQINILVQEDIGGGFNSGTVKIYSGISNIKNDNGGYYDLPLSVQILSTATENGKLEFTESNVSETLSFTARGNKYKITLEGATSGAGIIVRLQS